MNYVLVQIGLQRERSPQPDIVKQDEIALEQSSPQNVTGKMNMFLCVYVCYTGTCIVHPRTSTVTSNALECLINWQHLICIYLVIHHYLFPISNGCHLF